MRISLMVKTKRMDKLEYISGDLVIYASLIKEPIAEICEVHEASYTVKFMHGNFAATSKEIKPITLTPEILEKNGWKLSHGFNWSSNEEGAGVGLKSQTGYVWEAYIGRRLLRSNINNVSDLQHLLFGLGLNSEMEV